MIVEEVQKITLSLPEDNDYYEGLKKNDQYKQISEINNKWEHTVVFEKTLGTVYGTETVQGPFGNIHYGMEITRGFREMEPVHLPLGFTEDEVDAICRKE